MKVTPEMISDYMGAIHTLRSEVRDAKIYPDTGVCLDIETAERVLRWIDTMAEGSQFDLILQVQNLCEKGMSLGNITTTVKASRSVVDRLIRDGDIQRIIHASGRRMTKDTKERNARLLEDYLAGHTIRMITEKYKVSKPRVYQIAMAAGVSREKVKC